MPKKKYDISSMREWAPTEAFENIPAHQGLFFQDLNVTCVDVVREFIACGTDSGIVFWYNRANGDVQKLRGEALSPISCVRIVSSVEFMVAAGSANGKVHVFQIQKELPADLNLVAPLTKIKPVHRYAVRDLHKSPVTCCEWSKNGMKLFSGDKQGVVVLTEFDYQTQLSKSIEILNEACVIVQLSIYQSYLLVSTVFRAIICERDSNGKWSFLQIGKKDRKVLSELGGTFQYTSSKNPAIICSRPGLRFWIADYHGNVQQTVLFKDAMSSKPKWEIPILNPRKTQAKRTPTNFGRVYMYSENYIITHDDTALYILNLEKFSVEATAQHFRNILDISINENEIFVLEGPRTLIRIASCPEPPNKTAKIIFNPRLPPPLPSMPGSICEAPIEFETEEEAVINAEEVFELPPIQQIDLDIPIESELDSPTTKKNKIIMEQNRRIEVFDRITDMQFEDSILYKSGTSKKIKNTDSRKSKSGIVEIGQIVSETAEVTTNENNEILSFADKSTDTNGRLTGTETLKLELETDGHFMMRTDSLVPDPRSPDTLQRVLEPKQRALAEMLNIEPVKLEKISEEELQKTLRNNHPHQVPVWQDTFKYPTLSLDDVELQTTPRKKIHFITDDDDDISPKAEDYKVKTFDKLNNDMANIMIKSDYCSNSISKTLEKCDNKMTKSLQFISSDLIMVTPTTSTEDVPEIKKMPDYMKIPSLWNTKIEKVEESEQSDSHNSSDWELLEDS